MFQLIFLLTVLAILAGLIAFLGDRLGSYVGRKRLSLFGWRPRRTGRFIGILAGVLIMFSTLGVVSLIDRDLTRTIIQADDIRRENAQLNEERNLLQEEIQQGQEQLATAQQNFQVASQERDSALTERDALVSETATLTDELTTLRAQNIQADAQLSQVLTNLTAAEADLESANRERELALLVRDSAVLERDNAVNDANDAEQKLQVVREDLETAKRERELALLVRDSAILERDNAVNAANDAEEKLDLARAELDSSQSELADLEAVLVSTQENLDIAKIEINQSYIEANRYSQEVTKLKNQISDNLLANQQTLFRANLLRDQAEALQRQKELLEQEKLALESSNAELQFTLDDLFMRELVLESKVKELQERLDSSTEEAEASRAQLAEISQRAFSYAKGETIYNALIDASTTEEAFEQLSAMVTSAKQVVSNRGASGLNVSSEKVDSVIQEVLQTEEGDVVTLTAPDFIVMGQAVNPEVSIAENSVVAEAGKLIATRQLTVEESSTVESLESELSLLAEDANKRLQSLGMLSKLSPIQEDVSNFVQTLTDHQGSVVVGLVTTEAIYKASASGLELLVLR